MANNEEDILRVSTNGVLSPPCLGESSTRNESAEDATMLTTHTFTGRSPVPEIHESVINHLRSGLDDSFLFPLFCTKLSMQNRSRNNSRNSSSSRIEVSVKKQTKTSEDNLEPKVDEYSSKSLDSSLNITEVDHNVTTSNPFKKPRAKKPRTSLPEQTTFESSRENSDLMEDVTLNVEKKKNPFIKKLNPAKHSLRFSESFNSSEDCSAVEEDTQVDAESLMSMEKNRCKKFKNPFKAGRQLKRYSLRGKFETSDIDPEKIHENVQHPPSPSKKAKRHSPQVNETPKSAVNIDLEHPSKKPNPFKKGRSCKYSLAQTLESSVLITPNDSNTSKSDLAELAIEQGSQILENKVPIEDNVKILGSENLNESVANIPLNKFETPLHLEGASSLGAETTQNNQTIKCGGTVPTKPVAPESGVPDKDEENKEQEENVNIIAHDDAIKDVSPNNDVELCVTVEQETNVSSVPKRRECSEKKNPFKVRQHKKYSLRGEIDSSDVIADKGVETLQFSALMPETISNVGYQPQERDETSKVTGNIEIESVSKNSNPFKEERICKYSLARTQDSSTMSISCSSSLNKNETVSSDIIEPIPPLENPNIWTLEIDKSIDKNVGNINENHSDAFHLDASITQGHLEAVVSLDIQKTPENNLLMKQVPENGTLVPTNLKNLGQNCQDYEKDEDSMRRTNNSNTTYSIVEINSSTKKDTDDKGLIMNDDSVEKSSHCSKKENPFNAVRHCKKYSLNGKMEFSTDFTDNAVSHAVGLEEVQCSTSFPNLQDNINSHSQMEDQSSILQLQLESVSKKPNPFREERNCRYSLAGTLDSCTVSLSNVSVLSRNEESELSVIVEDILSAEEDVRMEKHEESELSVIVEDILLADEDERMEKQNFRALESDENMEVDKLPENAPQSRLSESHLQISSHLESSSFLGAERISENTCLMNHILGNEMILLPSNGISMSKNEVAELSDIVQEILPFEKDMPMEEHNITLETSKNFEENDCDYSDNLGITSHLNVSGTHSQLENVTSVSTSANQPDLEPVLKKQSIENEDVLPRKSKSVSPESLVSEKENKSMQQTNRIKTTNNANKVYVNPERKCVEICSTVEEVTKVVKDSLMNSDISQQKICSTTEPFIVGSQPKEVSLTEKTVSSFPDKEDTDQLPVSLHIMSDNIKSEDEVPKSNVNIELESATRKANPSGEGGNCKYSLVGTLNSSVMRLSYDSSFSTNEEAECAENVHSIENSSIVKLETNIEEENNNSNQNQNDIHLNAPESLSLSESAISLDVENSSAIFQFIENDIDVSPKHRSLIKNEIVESPSVQNILQAKKDEHVEKNNFKLIENDQTLLKDVNSLNRNEGNDPHLISLETNSHLESAISLDAEKISENCSVMKEVIENEVSCHSGHTEAESISKKQGEYMLESKIPKTTQNYVSMNASSESICTENVVIMHTNNTAHLTKKIDSGPSEVDENKITETKSKTDTNLEIVTKNIDMTTKSSGLIDEVTKNSGKRDEPQVESVLHKETGEKCIISSPKSRLSNDVIKEGIDVVKGERRKSSRTGTQNYVSMNASSESICTENVVIMHTNNTAHLTKKIDSGPSEVDENKITETKSKTDTNLEIVTKNIDMTTKSSGLIDKVTNSGKRDEPQAESVLHKETGEKCIISSPKSRLSNDVIKEGSDVVKGERRKSSRTGTANSSLCQNVEVIAFSKTDLLTQVKESSLTSKDKKIPSPSKTENNKSSTFDKTEEKKKTSLKCKLKQKIDGQNDPVTQIESMTSGSSTHKRDGASKDSRKKKTSNEKNVSLIDEVNVQNSSQLMKNMNVEKVPEATHRPSLRPSELSGNFAELSLSFDLSAIPNDKSVPQKKSRYKSTPLVERSLRRSRRITEHTNNALPAKENKKKPLSNSNLLNAISTETRKSMTTQKNKKCKSTGENERDFVFPVPKCAPRKSSTSTGLRTRRSVTFRPHSSLIPAVEPTKSDEESESGKNVVNKRRKLSYDTPVGVGKKRKRSRTHDNMKTDSFVTPVKHRSKKSGNFVTPENKESIIKTNKDISYETTLDVSVIVHCTPKPKKSLLFHSTPKHQKISMLRENVISDPSCTIYTTSQSDIGPSGSNSCSTTTLRRSSRKCSTKSSSKQDNILSYDSHTCMATKFGTTVEQKSAYSVAQRRSKRTSESSNSDIELRKENSSCFNRPPDSFNSSYSVMNETMQSLKATTLLQQSAVIVETRESERRSLTNGTMHMTLRSSRTTTLQQSALYTETQLSETGMTSVEENTTIPEKSLTLISKFSKKRKKNEDSVFGKTEKRKVLCKQEPLPKLAKPANWIKKELYTFLEDKLSIKYPLEKRYLSERIVLLLYNACTNTLLGHPELSLPSLKEELKLYDICKTQLDYFTFLNRFTPLEFIKKVVPLGRAYGNVNFKYERVEVYDPL